jgi:hypothetical protein
MKLRRLAALILLAGFARADMIGGSSAGTTPTSVCSGGNQFLTWNGSAYVCGTASGGGASTLQVTQSGVQITSPTASINLNSADFLVSLAGSATSQIALNPATTNYIHNQNTLQSNTTFYVTSGTITNSFNVGVPFAIAVSTGVMSVSSQLDPSIWINSASSENNEANMASFRWVGNITGVTTQVVPLFCKLTNLSSSVNPLADGVCGYFWARDTGGNGNIYGSNSRVTGQGTARLYEGSFSLAQWISPNGTADVVGTTSTIVAHEFQVQITSHDATTGLSTGTAITILIDDKVGSGKANQSWSVYSADKDPSWWKGAHVLGAAQAPPAMFTVIQTTVAVSTTSTYVAVFGTGTVGSGISASQYMLSVSSTGITNVNGTLTGAGLTTCGDSTHGLSWSAGTFGCQSITGTGGGGASSLSVGTGTASAYVFQASSPTAILNFSGSNFNSQLTGSATAFISLQSTQTFSSMTVTGQITASTITLTGSGAGEMDMTEGAAPSGQSSKEVVWGDSTDHWLKFNPNNGLSYKVVGATETLTANKVLVPTGTGAGVIQKDGYIVGFSTKSFTVTISSGIGFDNIIVPIWKAPDDRSVTITKILAESLPASTTVQYALGESAFGQINTSSSTIFNVAFSSANNTGVTTTTFADSSIAADASLVLYTKTSGAASGTPSYMTVTVYYKEN